MSSRWPQGQQDQRSPYAVYDESWPQENGADQPGQDGGWQAADQFGHADQWAQGSARQPGAPAAPARGAAVDQFQREWDEGAGGSGDDADYAWFQYLGGGRSSEPRADEVPAKREGRDSARRGGARTERPRSRRGKAADTGPVGPAAAEPGYGQPAGTSQNAATDPGQGRTGSRHGRAPASAEPGYGQAAAAGWPAVTDPGYQWQAGQAEAPAPVPGWPSAESGYDQAGPAGWPAAGDPAPGQAQVAGWPAAGDPRADQNPLPGWPAPSDPRYEHVPVNDWSAVIQTRPDPGTAADWSAVRESRHGKAPAADWAADPDTRRGQAPAADWAAADTGPHRAVPGWPAPDS